ncbi:MAG TPA: DinB family protein [Planctomycetota bacterium]
MTEVWEPALERLHAGLRRAFDELLVRVDVGDERLDRRPPDGGWTPREVLEHVTLTDRFLLILADKIAAKSRLRAARGAAWPAHPPRFEHLARLAGRELVWEAPAHMRPSGDVPTSELRARLAADRAHALALLDGAPGGSATLHRIRMSVVGGEDDRLDLYQFLEVVRLHAVRHGAQIERALAGS